MDENCLFGWASHKWLGKILIFAFVVGVICVMGFNYAISHISPLVFSSIQLVDPIMTGIIVWIAGIECIPDIYTWIGGFVVLSGVGLITYGEYQRTHVKNPNDNNEKNNNENEKNNNDIEKKSIELINDNSRDDSETVLLSDDDNISLLTDENESINSKTLSFDLERGNNNYKKYNINGEKDKEDVEEQEEESIVLNSSKFLQLNNLWNKNTSHEYSALPSVEDK